MEEPKMTGEEIVISGISGLFPNTENTRDLIRNLYNKVDMVAESTDTSLKHAELPKHFGRIHGLEKFDAQFFRVTPVQADSVDPVGRKILEQAYSAIFDAGINPETLKGSTLGVFIGSSISDNAIIDLFDKNKDGYVITGYGKTMLANRISYWIDGKGPSYGLDQACASSIACLELAFQRMKAGECDAALVGGCTHSMHPTLTINMKRAGLLCLDGKTKCFDKNGDGFVRSDAINMFFLQKSKDAKRIYAEVYNVSEKFFTKPDALFLPSRNVEDVAELMENLYSEIDVSPEEVEYVEANATGLVEADTNEVEAIAKVFAKNKPIKIGSIKSNMGHTQAVSGACSLTKLCLSYQKGKIPANLHCKAPISQITKEGRVQVVTENTKFGRGFTALNNFSNNGANYHVLLKGHYKPKQLDRYKTSLPRLVLASGRHDSSIYKIFDIIENNPIDFEELALLNNIFKYNTPGHTGRGYTILAPEVNLEVNKCLGKGFEYYSGTTRPVWFLYSGMGSQWVGMGAELMRIPIFAAAIQRCNDVLLPKGLDVYKIITEKDSSMFDNILHSFVGITAVQIGLTDILKALGLKPTNIIGHSAGEIACAYADECLSSEECILLSYYRGLVSLKTMLIKGKMAAIGLGHKEVRDLCPPEIDIACKNSATSTTISGPADAVEKFVADLHNQSIFARVVPSSNIAYHSRYIADAGPKLMAELSKVLKHPKTRTQKWLSTSFLPDQWNEVISKTASPEYFTYNLLNPVHFEEVASMIPADAIVIEVAPHGLMQAIVKRSHSSCLNVALTKRGSEDNVVVLLNALGTLYQAGLSLNVDVLYPQIDFPVSTETPVISHFVGWEHSENWSNSNFDLIKRTKMFAKEFNISIKDEEYNFIKHYKRNGVNIFPESAILIKVWETAAMYKETICEQLPITFTNVNFHDEVKIKPEEVLRLRVHVQPGSNLFEVTHDDKLITSGAIEFEFEDNYKYKAIPFDASSTTNLSTTDIYKLMHMRGYSCEGEFQCIQSANIERNVALLKWKYDWNFFLDALFQFHALSRDFDGVSVVKLINKLLINPIEHIKVKKMENNQVLYGAQIFRDMDICKCGGVVLKSVILKNEPVLENTVDILQTHTCLGPDLASNIEVVTVEENVSTFDNVMLVDNGNKYVWTEIASKEDAIEVAYAGISLKKHSGNKINKFGTAFSGITSRGEKVMGIVPDNNITSFLEPPSELLWSVPQFWTMEEAATVPLAYIQAYYCLTFRKGLNRKDTVLISNGDTGFGQALISICLSYDCTIFTTVKNLQKKKLLLRLFPKLKENQIGHSNKDSFLHMVRSATNGNGCDFVISDSKASLREAAMGCVGPSSTLLNICEVGMKMNETFGMACLTFCRNYMAVCFSNIFLEANFKERKILQSLLAEGIAMGVVRPLTRVVYTPTKISRAFKLLSKNNQFGKILINIQEAKFLKKSYDILPRIQLNPRNIYIVVCDGSELSVELVEHLIRRGARQLLLHVEPQMMDGYFQVKYALWKKNNVDVQFNGEDLNIKSNVESFIRVGTKQGSVGGIFICQNEVNNPVDNNHAGNFASIVASLDSASRNIGNFCYFAVITLTLRRLTNDAELSNIENCCFERNKLGLPALALRHAINGKNISRSCLSKLFNALDSSLKKNLISVLSADQLEEPVTKSNPVSIGFGAFFRQYDIDEYKASEPMICMKTQLNNENESELYMDPDEDHLMIVPGFDGFHENMTTVSERLKIQAVTLQLEPDFDKSIDQIASRLVKLVKTRFHLKSKFYLFGYSFGVNVALKTAALLEEEGRRGIVFCLDSSPDALRKQLNTFLGDMTDAHLQNSLIQHIYNLLTGKTSSELKKNLETMENWSEKVDLFVRNVKNSVSYTHEFLRSYINVSYRRLVLAREYQPDFKLNSEVVLIKGAPHPKCIQSEDYGLSKFTKKPVKVFDIQADHVNAPYDCRVSAIVNKMLDHKFLEIFKKKNLCQYYLETTI